MVSFTGQSKLFKNEQILSPEYLPDILPYRESQTQYLADNLSRVTKSKVPHNIFIFGPPGLGKTASAKYVFREFENYSGMETIYINCWDFNTSNSVLSEIASKLGAFVQRRGWAKDEIMCRMVEKLEKLNKSLLICLDEADQLIYKDQNLLYDLIELNGKIKNPISMIFISNNPHVFAKLESRIMSRLNLDEIEFKAYTLQEMKGILQERAEEAFTSIEEGVVALAAAHAINKNGDVRVGLQCLINAGRKAEQNNESKLKVGHVKEILRNVKEAKPQILKENVSDLEKNILDLVNGNDKMSFDELYVKYSGTVESPLTKRMFREYVDHLDSIGLIKWGILKSGKSRFILKV